MDTSQPSKAAFLYLLERFAAEPVPHQKVVGAFQAIPEEDLTTEELKKLG